MDLYSQIIGHLFLSGLDVATVVEIIGILALALIVKRKENRERRWLRQSHQHGGLFVLLSSGGGVALLPETAESSRALGEGVIYVETLIGSDGRMLRRTVIGNKKNGGKK